VQKCIVSNANELNLQKLIELGAKTFLVPGNLPIGCIPKYLILFKSDKKEDYEPETGCLRWLNEFSEYHNKLLIDELGKLRKLHSGVSIIYADYYEAAMEIFVSPKKFGEFKALYFFQIQKVVIGCIRKMLFANLHIPILVNLTNQDSTRFYVYKKIHIYICLL
jgi:hypothetical protein